MNVDLETPPEPQSRRRLAVTSAAIGFLSGALVVAVLGVMWERRHGPAAAPETAATAVEGAPMMTTEPAPAGLPPVIPTPLPDSDALLLLEPAPLADLRSRQLEMPVVGARRDALRSMFAEARGTARTHEALDILAAKGTPVIAVEDGTIAKLFVSEAGGITLYQFDPTTTYAYYYAHLDRYADGLTDGAHVRRGQVIGYVGVTGNAPKDTPHLHFAIFQLTETKQWWKGTPIDPFPVLK